MAALLAFLFLGVVVGVPVYIATHKEGAGGGAPPLGPGPLGTVPLTHDEFEVACPEGIVTNPNPSSTAPVAGQATAMGYQWCHDMREGENPGVIVAYFFGGTTPPLEAELRAANPTSSFAIGQRVKLPLRWDPWIDQKGMPRGGIVPFPPYDKSNIGV